MLALDALAPETLRRLDRTTRGDGCVVLSQRPALLLSPEALALLGVLGLVLACAVLLPRFGRLEPPKFSALTRTAMLGGGLLSLTAGALLSARRWRLRRGMRVDPGVYVLARDLLDARSAQIIVRPLSTLGSIVDEQTREQGHGVRLTFEDGASYVLPCYGTNATRMQRDLAELRTALDQAHEVGKPERLLWLDPFHHERARWSRAVPPPAEPPPGPSFRLSWATAAAPVAAALLALPALAARDRLSVGWGVSAARRAGDDEALRRFVEENGAMGDEVDQVRLRMALDDGSPEALSRYIQRGGRSAAVADDALLAKVASDGSLASLDRYLSLGQRHRDRILAQLLARGVDQFDAEALRVYERHRGPRVQEVTAAYLPRARMLDPTQAPLPTREVRGFLDIGTHPIARETAEQVLQRRIDQRLAQLPGHPADGSLDARTLLLAVRPQSGGARLLVRRSEPQASTPTSWPPQPVYDPREPRLNFTLNMGSEREVLGRLVAESVQSALDEVFEPGLIDVRRWSIVSGFPASGSDLRVDYEAGPMPSKRAWALPGGFSLPIRVTLSVIDPAQGVRSLTLQTAAHIDPPKYVQKPAPCPIHLGDPCYMVRLAPPSPSAVDPLPLRSALRL